ncbi:DUF6998 domain-containing protein [Acidipropionibacterium jensenii]|uniref:DUF6998 domain-containing protein n=1 Tax=Acidipropionibacterium jensenii TaxID=1749 RepID=UPI002649B430|nr:hypothetical protein [Acidipropionibacterium jensenii]MDN6428006.1 hypothetical protein [Acidipropionibacterium jensenii]
MSEGQSIDCQQVSTGIDLAVLGVQDLLQLDAAIITELRRRNLVRPNNKPLGDIAEAVVHAARGGTLENNSTKSHDITAPGGQRIQVKARTMQPKERTVRFSVFRSTGLLHDLRQVGYAAVMAGVFIMVSYSTGVNRPRPTCRRRR